MATFQKITLNFWFNDQAEKAVKFYTYIFKNSSTGRISRHKTPKGSVLTIEFQLEG